jgi:hypothetical protein
MFQVRLFFLDKGYAMWEVRACQLAEGGHLPFES